MPTTAPQPRAVTAVRPVGRSARLAAAALLVVAAAGASRAAGAQMVTVDEGSFTVSRGGATLGREEFRIVRQPGGAATYVARATAAYGDRRIVPALQAGDDGTPERYQVEVRRGAALEQRVSAQAAGTHFRAQVQSESGEAAREFLLEPGTVVLDDELYHQYHFLVRRAGEAGAAARVSVLAPRRGTQTTLRIALAGTERLTVAGQSVTARHYSLTDPAGGRREVWADDQGRVLRVVLPAEGLEAVRSEPPR